MTKPLSTAGSGSGAGGAGTACEGIGVGGPTTGSGIEGVDSDGGGVYIGGAPVSAAGAPHANDLNSSDATSPVDVPGNGAGVSGFAADGS